MDEIEEYLSKLGISPEHQANLMEMIADYGRDEYTAGASEYGSMH